MAYRIQIRRDTSSNWTSNNPILLQGEFGYELNTGYAKIGDGQTAWTALDYFGGTGPTGPTGPDGPDGPEGKPKDKHEEGPEGTEGPKGNPEDNPEDNPDGPEGKPGDKPEGGHISTSHSTSYFISRMLFEMSIAQM